MDNSNFQDQQQEIIKIDALSQYTYKNKQVSWKESSTQNNRPQKNNQLKEQTQTECQAKLEAQSQNQENDTEQFYPSQKQIKIPLKMNQNKRSRVNFIKQMISINIKYYHKLPAFNVNIQITRIYHKNQILKIPLRDNRIEYRKKNELQPTQQIQSNTIQSQYSEMTNKSEVSPTINSEVSGTQNQESFEIRLKFSDDPDLQAKQQLLLEIHDILKQIKIRSNCKRHSILEDALQLCLMYIPQIRVNRHSFISEQFYQQAKEIYQLERNRQAFARRFYHLLLFSNSWTLQNITNIHKIIMKYQQTQLESYHLFYDIKTKTLQFPTSIVFRQMPEKPKVIQQIIQNEQNKRIVLSLTTKTLFNMQIYPQKKSMRILKSLVTNCNLLI